MKSNRILIVLLLLIAGCVKREVVPKISSTDYFPLRTGAYWIYDVLSTSITQLGGQTSSVYEMKIQIMDSIIVSGQTRYIMQQFTRNSSSQSWTSVGTVSARKDAYNVIVQEGNIPYLKLLLPLNEGTSWNANVYNTLGGNDRCADGTFNCDNYQVVNVAKRFEGTTIAFENTVTVIENNDNDPIVRSDVRKSVYAKSVGLIYKETTILEYCTVGNCIGKQIVENGTIVKQTIKDYGGL